MTSFFSLPRNAPCPCPVCLPTPLENVNQQNWDISSIFLVEETSRVSNLEWGLVSVTPAPWSRRWNEEQKHLLQTNIPLFRDALVQMQEKKKCNIISWWKGSVECSVLDLSWIAALKIIKDGSQGLQIKCVERLYLNVKTQKTYLYLKQYCIVKFRGVPHLA